MSRSILLVDDGHQELTETIARAVQLAGFRPLRASSPPAALDVCDAERPDLAVLDVNLGQWSGLDVLEQLRKRSSMPIIVLGGAPSEHLEMRSIELGADDFLTTPIDSAELVTRIRARLAQNRRAREQLEVHVQLNAGLRGLVEAGDRLFLETRQAVLARDALLAGVAHDLQPALSAIQRLALRRRLRSARTGGTIDPLVHALEQIENHAVDMAEGLNHLLALAALEIGVLPREDENRGQPGAAHR
jgi:DNA-binding response OmpR family regulator